MPERDMIKWDSGLRRVKSCSSLRSSASSASLLGNGPSISSGRRIGEKSVPSIGQLDHGDSKLVDDIYDENDDSDWVDEED
jgi:hypothetical protein